MKQSLLAKIEIIRSAEEWKQRHLNIIKETNMEMTDKLRAIGAYPFWWSWHPRKDGSVIFRAFGVADASEAAHLQWNNREARIRIGFKP